MTKLGRIALPSVVAADTLLGTFGTTGSGIDMSENREAALAALREAFPETPVSFESGGAWMSYLEADEFEAEASGHTWASLGDAFLEKHHDAVAYATPAIFAALLPAWLRALLMASDELDMLPYFVVRALSPGETSEDAADFAERTRLLTSAQMAAVARGLAVLVHDADYADHRDDIEHALTHYWSARRS